MKTLKGIVIQIVLLVSMLLIVQSAWALRLPANVDSDSIPDAMEQWLLDQGVSTDDGGAPIVPGGVNTYNDTDSDTIPDIIETNVTKTVVGENDLVGKNCPGDGTVNFSSIRALRIATSGSISSGQNLKLQYLSNYAICHDGVNAISAYIPFIGYTNPAKSSFIETSPGMYSLVLTWTEQNIDVAVLAAQVSAATIQSNGRITGTITLTSNSGTTTLSFGSSRQADAIDINQISGVFGAQSKVIDSGGPLAATEQNIRNPGSRVGFLAVNPGGAGAATSVVLYTSRGDVYPGFFVPSVGSLFIASAVTKQNQEKETIKLISIFHRDKAAANGSAFRGEIYAKLESGGQVTKEQYENFYARHGATGEGAPEVVAHTIVRPNNRRFTRLHYLNVRLLADQITIDGPNAFSNTLVDINSPTMSYTDNLRMRNLIPGFVDNPAIGVAGGDGQRREMRVSQLIFEPSVNDATQVLADGSYSVTSSVANNPGLDRTHTGNYTASNLNYSVVSDVQLNGINWATGTPINNVGANTSHTITFNHSDQINTNRYQLILRREDGGSLNSFAANRLFIRNNTNTLLINNGVLEPDAEYCVRIQARNSMDSTLRSETDLLCFNTVPGASLGDGGNNQNPDIAGSWVFTETVNSANGVCSGDVGQTTNRNVDITQNQDIISVTIDGSAPISGTISGNQIQLGGNLPQDGGVTTFSLSATVAGNCITGTSNWSWADQTSSCPVGQSSIEGTPTNDPNACTSAKPTTGGGGGGGSTGLWFLSVLLTVLCFRNRRIRMVLK